jgi:FKBP-type peptidyl-prolyl cis-trans isomerase FkpA
MKWTALLSFLLLYSCTEKQIDQEKEVKWTKEKSIQMNANFAEEEDKEIAAFLKRHPDWSVEETGTGLRYMIYHKGDRQDSVFADDIVSVQFEVSLLSGEVCYSSEKNQPEEFKVEHADIESGLHEGVKLLCKGDKAKFILPSHLAHGLIGDTDKIPPLSPVIYDIELINIRH